MKVTSFVSSLLPIVGLFWLGPASTLTFAQESIGTPSSVTDLMQQMPGTWEVQARMWPAANVKAVEFPPATAHRVLIRNAFLQETMEPKLGSEGPSFTRVAYLSYNASNRQYEYFSLDSRLPQMMSYAIPGANRTHDGRIELRGSSFVAPEWGADKNVPFMYRFVISPLEGGKQVAQMFLTRQNGRDAEFLAFEYVYTRRN